jgi:ribonuclease BN (tRNA processing enzyme)
VRLTTLGGCGAWPTAGAACSGYLVEHGGFRVLIDPGYATLPVLLEFCAASEIDAVVVSHGHPDHCADLNPLLRARVLESWRPKLPVYAPHDALDAVLALDKPGMLDGGLELHEFSPGDELGFGPFTVRTWLLPHWMPNAGMRLETGGESLAYTGDTGPSPHLLELARDVDVLLAEATYLDTVPEDSALFMSSARQAGELATRAGAGRLILTHLWPGTSTQAAITEAARSFDPDLVSVAARP